MDCPQGLGERFLPTAAQLLYGYLRRKMAGLPLPTAMVEEKDLYAGAPWEVLPDDGTNLWLPEHDDEDNIIKKYIYVFVKLSKKAAAGRKRKYDGDGGKEQFIRTAGCGSWHGQIGPKEIKKNGETLGFKRMLTFEVRELSPSFLGHEKGHWIMHELSIDKDGESDYVLCEIVLDLLKSCKIKSGLKRGIEEADTDLVQSPNKRWKKQESVESCSDCMSSSTSSTIVNVPGSSCGEEQWLEVESELSYCEKKDGEDQENDVEFPSVVDHGAQFPLAVDHVQYSGSTNCSSSCLLQSQVDYGSTCSSAYEDHEWQDKDFVELHGLLHDDADDGLERSLLTSSDSQVLPGSSFPEKPVTEGGLDDDLLHMDESWIDSILQDFRETCCEDAV